MHRVNDVKATLNQLEKWNIAPQSRFFKRLNLKQIGIGGHSFGAITSQAVAGQSFPVVGQTFTDERLKAAFMMSPSLALKGSDDYAFGKVKVPWLLMTGTRDETRITKTTAESRKLVYKHLPAGGKYQLVLKDAKHMAFSDRTILGGAHRNKNHHRVIKAISTAFFEAHLKGDAEAQEWIRSKEPRRMLQLGDTWEKK